MSSPVTDEVNDLIHWDDLVDPDDFNAAETYLSVLLGVARAVKTRAALEASYRAHGVRKMRANDVLRACGRSPLPDSDPGVFHARVDILKGKKLSPVLVVTFGQGGDIADGYHRISAAYNLDPFADVFGVLAEVPRK